MGACLEILKNLNLTKTPTSLKEFFILLSVLRPFSKKKNILFLTKYHLILNIIVSLTCHQGLINIIMDKLKLTGRALGQVFNFRSDCMYTMLLLPSVTIQPNLELKTQTKQLLGSLPLVITLPDIIITHPDWMRNAYSTPTFFAWARPHLLLSLPKTSQRERDKGKEREREKEGGER